MLDPKLIRNNPQKVADALKKRKADQSMIGKFAAVDEKWREITFKVEDLKKQRNENSEKIGAMKKSGEDANDLVAQTKAIGDRIKELEHDLNDVDAELKALVLEMPNMPHHTVQEGADSRDNLEIRKWGEPKRFDFKPAPHDEVAVKLGYLNFEEAARLSGARFVVGHGEGARLERALMNLMLDVHIKEHGYEEVSAPVLVRRHCLEGTGQLPKFEEDLFKCSDELFLIPTAEVSVTNIHRGQVIPMEKLPIKYCSYSSCFRREAGSYGKDVKGILRQHQFNKVELVKFTEPERSYDELEKLTADAEKILQMLGLPYRVVQLCTGDLGFASAKTYDIEVWFPSENEYREISSCSNFEDFQARRADIRFRRDQRSKPEFVHTLNGSGLAIGRTLAAIFENFQNEDGTITVPEVLKAR